MPSPVRMLSLVLALSGAVLVAAATPAAAVTGGHDPVGSVETVTPVGKPVGSLSVSGWAGDTDAGTNVVVSAVLDGTRSLARTTTSIARPKVAAARHISRTPGFVLSVPLSSVPTKGRHAVCIVAENLGMGASTVLHCLPLPWGTTLSDHQLAAHNPVGAFTGAFAHPASVHVHGWVDDPDLLARRSTVVLYLDGSAVRTIRTASNPDGPVGAGPKSMIDIRVPVSSGNHVACLWAVNTGLGDNTYLGCRAVNTRGKAGTGTVVPPPVNAKVVKEARKHIGQRYVWATEGPKTFDCSGLVIYSYQKNGLPTPRVARDQFHAANLIPQSRAVPGDLVFYATAEGYVHHVGIYTGPGMSIAAIDPAEGVDWQAIYPNDTTYYGSFTHS